MRIAKTSQRRGAESRLLVVPSSGLPAEHGRVGDLSRWLRRGDLLVINRAGTLPGRLQSRIERTGEKLELRLAAYQGDTATPPRVWQAVLFGTGDWRIPTEERRPPPRIRVGDHLRIGSTLEARILEVDPDSPRLIKIKFLGEDFLSEIYREGAPIQYSYQRNQLEIWDQQTVFSTTPLSAEPPSAGFAFSWKLLEELRELGVSFAFLLHSAGISSTGDPALDARLPLPEFYEIPPETASAVKYTLQRGGRIIALGTSVVRALETAALDSPLGEVRSGTGLSTLHLNSAHRLRVVSAVFTGIHAPGSSHLQLAEAFCGRKDLDLAYQQATERGYLLHEYGDLSLLFASPMRGFATESGETDSRTPGSFGDPDF